MYSTMTLSQPRQHVAVRFGNTAPNGIAGQREFIARLKGIEESLKDGTLTFIEAEIPGGARGRDLDEACIRGTLQKSDGQKYSLMMGGNMSGRSFTLENEAKTVKYQFAVQCFTVDIEAYDQRPGKEFAYAVKKFDTLNKKDTPMEQLVLQARQMRKELVKAVKAYQENPPVKVADVPSNRDF